MDKQDWIEEANRNLVALQRAEAEAERWKARAADEARRCLENGMARGKAEAEVARLRQENAELREQLEVEFRAAFVMPVPDHLASAPWEPTNCADCGGSGVLIVAIDAARSKSIPCPKCQPQGSGARDAVVEGAVALHGLLNRYPLLSYGDDEVLERVRQIVIAVGAYLGEGQGE